MKSVIFYCSLMFLPLMCGKSTDKNDLQTETPYETAAATTEMAASEPSSSGVSSDNKSTPLAAETQEMKIIKTANLRFQTQNILESYQHIHQSLKKYNAIIQHDNSGKNYNETYRNLTIRIPNIYFDSCIKDLEQGVDYFDRKEISAQDVTEEYIDIEARLKAKQQLEQRYLDLLKKATKVSEILEIEQQLAIIREEIEAKQGQLKYLNNRVSMSTINIEMYTESAKGTGTTVSYGTKMWNAVKSGFNGISSFFLGLLYIWPIILIFGIVFFVVKRKWINKK